MKVKIKNKNQFIKNILTPLKTFADEAIIDISEESITTASSFNDGEIVFCGEYYQENDESTTINIEKVNTFIKLLQSIAADDITFTYDENCIKFSDDLNKFKFHVLEDELLTRPDISFESIDLINWDGEFSICKESVKQLVKVSSFVEESHKVYFYKDEDGIYAEVTDNQKNDVDSFTQKVSSEYRGVGFENKIPINFTLFGMLGLPKYDMLDVSICSEYDLMMFTIKNDIVKLRYIVSPYTG